MNSFDHLVQSKRYKGTTYLLYRLGILISIAAFLLKINHRSGSIVMVILAMATIVMLFIFSFRVELSKGKKE